jgi:hypothetical protein
MVRHIRKFHVCKAVNLPSWDSRDKASKMYSFVIVMTIKQVFGQDKSLILFPQAYLLHSIVLLEQ